MAIGSKFWYYIVFCFNDNFPNYVIRLGLQSHLQFIFQIMTSGVHSRAAIVWHANMETQSEKEGSKDDLAVLLQSVNTTRSDSKIAKEGNANLQRARGNLDFERDS